MAVNSRGQRIVRPVSFVAVRYDAEREEDVEVEIHPILEWSEGFQDEIYIGRRIVWPDGWQDDNYFEDDADLPADALALLPVEPAQAPQPAAVPADVVLVDVPGMDLPPPIGEIADQVVAQARQNGGILRGDGRVDVEADDVWNRIEAARQRLAAREKELSTKKDPNEKPKETEDKESRYSRIFIYGPYEEDFKEFESLGNQVIDGYFSLYAYRNFPILWDNTGWRKNHVYGKLYRVPTKRVKELDEKYQIGSLKRTKVHVVGSYDPAWTYIWSGTDLPGAKEKDRDLVYIPHGRYATWKTDRIEELLEEAA